MCFIIFTTTNLKLCSLKKMRAERARKFLVFCKQNLGQNDNFGYQLLNWHQKMTCHMASRPRILPATKNFYPPWRALWRKKNPGSEVPRENFEISVFQNAKWSVFGTHFVTNFYTEGESARSGGFGGSPPGKF